MDHSLRALLAQNNDPGHEQEIYYLSRIMIGAEHQYNLIEKRMLGADGCYSENATLPSGPNHTCHIKSQSFKIAYDKAIVAE